MRYFELRDFRMVKAISDAGNLTRAAKSLHVSQPALSRQLLDLEDRIGSAVFKRSPRKMLLTPIGQEILESAIEVLTAVENTEKSILNKTKHHPIYVHQPDASPDTNAQGRDGSCVVAEVDSREPA